MSPILYPKAKWHALAGHSAPGRIEDRDLVVLHITEGSTAAGAIATFEQSKTPGRVSAHFVIDRDGTVYQLLDIRETAWHASAVNARSIGIEHAATTKGLPATEAQYAASAALVAWCCERMNVPCDRAHVRTHNEASPRDGHVLCCTGGLDPERVVAMAADAIRDELAELRNHA